MSEVMISKRRDFLCPVAIGQIDPAQFEQGLRAYLHRIQDRSVTLQRPEFIIAVSITPSCRSIFEKELAELLGEFSKIMQTFVCVSGLRNSLEFFQTSMRC